MVKPINPVLACISLAVQRIYGSMDNPYTGILAFLMLTWTVHKLSIFERIMAVKTLSAPVDAEPPFLWGRFLDLLLDCFVLSIMLYTGIVIQVRVCHVQICSNGVGICDQCFSADGERPHHHNHTGSSGAPGCIYSEQGIDSSALFRTLMFNK